MPVDSRTEKWKQYTKKAAKIRAIQFSPHMNPWPHPILSWPDETGFRPKDMSFGYIKTPEGKMRVMAGDWIIQGVKGEFYPCKPDIFADTYDLDEIPDPALVGAASNQGDSHDPTQRA